MMHTRCSAQAISYMAIDNIRSTTDLCPGFGEEHHVSSICKLLETRPAWFLGLDADTNRRKLLSQILNAAKSHVRYTTLVLVSRVQWDYKLPFKHRNIQCDFGVPQSGTKSISGRVHWQSR